MFFDPTWAIFLFHILASFNEQTMCSIQLEALQIAFQTLTWMVSSLSRRKLTPFSSYIFKQWGHLQSLALQPLLKKNGPTGSGLGPSATSSGVLKQLGPLDVAFWRWWRVEICFCSVIVPSLQSTTHSPDISAFEGSAWATIGVTFSCFVPLR